MKTIQYTVSEDTGTFPDVTVSSVDDLIFQVGFFFFEETPEINVLLKDLAQSVPMLNASGNLVPSSPAMNEIEAALGITVTTEVSDA